MTSEFFGIELAKPSMAVVLGGVAPTFSGAIDYEFDVVIAADSGAQFADDAGLTIDSVIGDMDSIATELLTQLEQRGVDIRRFDPDKDATDFELALQLADERAVASVVVIGGHGGRVDHSLVNVAVLSSPNLKHLEIHAVLDESLVSVVHGGSSYAFFGQKGELVTLLAVHGEAVGVRTQGLHYELNGESLSSSSSRGVSNYLNGERAEVSLQSGSLLVIRQLREK